MLAVERCFDSRKKKIILWVVWVLVAIALLGLAYWFGSEVDWEDPRDSGTDETRATVNLTIAFIFLAMLTAVGSFFSFYDTGEEAHTFTYIRGGFGKDFANLMSSLEKTPNQLVEMDEIQLKAIATEVLIKQAQEVLEAEQRDVENFKGLHLPRPGGGAKPRSAHEAPRPLVGGGGWGRRSPAEAGGARPRGGGGPPPPPPRAGA